MTRRLIDKVVRRLEVAPGDADALVAAEWLVTNGIGGYSSGTVAGVATRRYHGLLIASLPNPLGRTVMLNHLAERLVLPSGDATPLGGHEGVAGRLDPRAAERLHEFRLEAGLPVWEYEWRGIVLQKRVLMPYGQNTVHVTYKLLEGGPARLELSPGIHFRGYEEPVDAMRLAPRSTPYRVIVEGQVYEVHADDEVPPLHLHFPLAQPDFVGAPRVTSEFLYPVEEHRGYVHRGTLWTPGHFNLELEPGVEVALVASAERPDVFTTLDPEDARICEAERRRRLLAQAQAEDELTAELVLAADQFVITPTGRAADAVRARASGDEVRTIIAGYHWFTDWGRDTMISLEGLTLVTGRAREAGFILRTFAHYVRDGLIPNMFPDGSNEGLYHTADATLWFFHAVERYLRYTENVEMLRQLLPTMKGIVDAHLRGTRFGIAVDPTDGLLRQGEEGYQLTWMDAKVDGWVVTPRRGKAVEINALWYNALRNLTVWLEESVGEDAADPYRREAERVRESFNARFWSDELGYLRDVVDGEDGDSAECRPNQILAISLEHPVLSPERWPRVVEVVRERLLTPVGLRSLAPGEPDYKDRYYGDLRARDAAYHQGTVWGWLIGPWTDAWLKVHPEDLEGARRSLEGLVAHLGEFGVGSVAEVFDAEPPFTPRGCVAQAWSVAELLRCLSITRPS